MFFRSLISSSSFSRNSHIRNIITILPMPKLSPTTKTCRLLKWHVKEGVELSSYSLICEIETNTLTNVVNNNDDISSKLEIEIQEEGWVSKLLCSEGDIISVGKPIAILVEDFQELSMAKDIPVDSIGEDVYSQSKYLMVGWQAYVKTKNDPGQCGCS